MPEGNLTQGEQYELTLLQLESAVEAYRNTKGIVAYLLKKARDQQDGLNRADDPKTERARWKALREKAALGNYDLKALDAFARRELREAVIQDDGDTVKLQYLHIIDPVAIGRIGVALAREKITVEQADTLQEEALTRFWFPEKVDMEIKAVASPDAEEKGPTLEQIRSACKHLAELDGEITVERFEEMEETDREGYGTDCKLLGGWLKSQKVKKPEPEDPNQTHLPGVEPEEPEGDNNGKD